MYGDLWLEKKFTQSIGGKLSSIERSVANQQNNQRWTGLGDLSSINPEHEIKHLVHIIIILPAGEQEITGKILPSPKDPLGGLVVKGVRLESRISGVRIPLAMRFSGSSHNNNNNDKKKKKNDNDDFTERCNSRFSQSPSLGSELSPTSMLKRHTCDLKIGDDNDDLTERCDSRFLQSPSLGSELSPTSMLKCHTRDLKIGTPVASLPSAIGSVLGLVSPVSVYYD